MAQFDISKAITVKTDNGQNAGYILQHTPDLWLPLALDRENISGTTYKDDAKRIVLLHFKASSHPRVRYPKEAKKLLFVNIKRLLVF